MDKLTIFIALTGLAVALQAGVLLAMYLAMRKSGDRLEELAASVKTKILPTVEQAQEMLTVLRPKVEVIVDNLQDATTVVRSQIQRVDATVNDVVDRTRLQVIRADEMMTKTLDRVEQTTEMVQNTVVSPVRQISGLMRGLTVGLEFLFAGGARKNGASRDERRAVPQDEMFI
jgi:chromatin segregation and condensation protein Rec8/ScpA/Scc1 (kleisin family)